MAKQMGARGYVRGPQKKPSLRATRDVEKHGHGNVGAATVVFVIGAVLMLFQAMVG